MGRTRAGVAGKTPPGPDCVTGDEGRQGQEGRGHPWYLPVAHRWVVAQPRAQAWPHGPAPRRVFLACSVSASGTAVLLLRATGAWGVLHQVLSLSPLVAEAGVCPALCRTMAVQACVAGGGGVSVHEGL